MPDHVHAHSLEVRVPLLDDRLVHVALALPASTRAKGDKGILARAAESTAQEAAVRSSVRRVDEGAASGGRARCAHVADIAVRRLSSLFPCGDTFGRASRSEGLEPRLVNTASCGCGRKRTASVGKAMNVLLTVPSLSPEFGGPAAKVQPMAAVLREAGHNVNMVGPARRREPSGSGGSSRSTKRRCLPTAGRSRSSSDELTSFT